MRRRCAPRRVAETRKRAPGALRVTQSAPRPRHAAVPLPGVGKFLAKAFAVGFFGKTKDLSLLLIDKKITECGEAGRGTLEKLENRVLGGGRKPSGSLRKNSEFSREFFQENPAVGRAVDNGDTARLRTSPREYLPVKAGGGGCSCKKFSWCSRVHRGRNFGGGHFGFVRCIPCVVSRYRPDAGYLF